MSPVSSEPQLKTIPVESIDRNEDNPRIFFRQDEMDDVVAQRLKGHLAMVNQVVERRELHPIRSAKSVKRNIGKIPDHGFKRLPVEHHVPSDYGMRSLTLEWGGNRGVEERLL